MNKWRRDQASFTGDLGPNNHMGTLRHYQATFILGWETSLSGSIRISPVSIHRYGSLPEITSPHYWSCQDLNVNPSVWDRYDPLTSSGCCCSVARSHPALCNPMDCSPPGSSVHRILWATMLKRVPISSSRVSSWPWDQVRVSFIANGFFTIWATREAQHIC